MRTRVLILCYFFVALTATAQQEVAPALPLKISHVEPLYIDMIRDLGARKGEREINAGWQCADKEHYQEQGGFVEYEFSPCNRLGLEVELPFHYRYKSNSDTASALPRSKLDAVKLAFQYTFWVSAKHQLSMAFGGIYELELHSLYSISNNRPAVFAQDLNPFLIIAKRFGKHIHSLLYAGPVMHRDFENPQHSASCQLNWSIHWRADAGHFIGLELNEEFDGTNSSLYARPQAKLKFSSTTSLGLVPGIPLYATKNGLELMFRLIYEPRN